MRGRIIVTLAAVIAALATAGSAAGVIPYSLGGGGDGGGDACAASSTWETYGTAGTSGFYIGYISTIICNANNTKVSGSACNQIWIQEGSSGVWQDLKASCETISNPVNLQLSGDPATMAGRVNCPPTNTTQKYRANIGWYAQFADGKTEVLQPNTSSHSYNCLASPF